MMESSFVVVVESTLPASGGYTTMDVSTHQILPSSATLMSTISEMEPIMISDIITSTGLLTTMFSVQKMTVIKTILQTTTMPPESVTFSGQTTTTLTTLISTTKLTTAISTVLPTFMMTSPTPSVLITTEESQTR